MLRKPVGFVFGEDQFPVRLHIEDAVPALDKLRFRAELALDGVRQTGGLGQVVSLDTVGNGYPHGFLLF